MCAEYGQHHEGVASERRVRKMLEALSENVRTNNSGEFGKLKGASVCTGSVKRSTIGPPKEAPVRRSVGRWDVERWGGEERKVFPTMAPGLLYRTIFNATWLVTSNVTM